MKKEIPMNKICWVRGCERRLDENLWPYCKKCAKKSDKKLKVPGIKGFDNTPTKI
jgi:hypothetical protein